MNEGDKTQIMIFRKKAGINIIININIKHKYNQNKTVQKEMPLKPHIRSEMTNSKVG